MTFCTGLVNDTLFLKGNSNYDQMRSFPVNRKVSLVKANLCMGLRAYEVAVL
jgi:hypothetical protein